MFIKPSRCDLSHEPHTALFYSLPWSLPLSMWRNDLKSRRPARPVTDSTLCPARPATCLGLSPMGGLRKRSGRRQVTPTAGRRPSLHSRSALQSWKGRHHIWHHHGGIPGRLRRCGGRRSFHNVPQNPLHGGCEWGQGTAVGAMLIVRLAAEQGGDGGGTEEKTPEPT